MTMHSTSKMLASMLEKNSSASENAIEQKKSLDLFDMPNLRPSLDMELALSNILGSSLNKEYSPMD